MASSPRIAYLVHNLQDPAVLRRVRMAEIGGATVEVAGFRRNDGAPKPLGGVVPIDLGRTRDAGFLGRIMTIAREGRRRGPVTDMIGRADVVVARTLEVLVFAAMQMRLSGSRAPLVYESLDIHRLLLAPRHPAGVVLRAIESALAERCALLITSSPAFVRNYFSTRKGLKDLPILLLENKVLVQGEGGGEGKGAAARPDLPAGPPWRIGWFGALRDRKGFDLLARLVARLDGRIEVVMRGIPSEAVFPDGLTEKTLPKGIRYLGRYAYPDDLEAIYNDIHFTWAIDFFEEGLNSTWLLPNRVYEGGLHASVPIALGSVETGRMVERLGTGIVLPDDLEPALVSLFETMTAERYAALKARARTVPVDNFITTPKDCVAMVDRLADLADLARSPRRRS